MSKKTKQAKVPSTSKHKAKMGRPAFDVDELMCKIMYDAPKALSDIELATYVGISEATFYSLKKNNLKFLEVVKEYKRISPLEVMQALKKSAVGYSFTEKTRELQKDRKTGNYKLTVTKEVEKFIAPSATAGIFYLKNRMPEHFKDRIEQAHSFTGGALENITLVIKGRNG